MSTPHLALPDDVDALKTMVVAMAEKAALMEERAFISSWSTKVLMSGSHV